jgi:hypothetical protein
VAITLASLRADLALSTPRIVLYGRPGWGKTTWAATAPKPVFLLTEDGLTSVRPTPQHTPLCRSYRDVCEWVQALRTEQHDYQTLVLDSLDGLEPLMVEFVAKQDGKTAEDFALGKGNFGYGKGELRLADEMRVFLELLSRLREEKNMAIVLLAHDRVKRFDAPDSESFDRYQLSLPDKVAKVLQAWADVTAFGFYRVSTTKGQDGKVRGVGAGERLVGTDDSAPTRVGKNRYSLPSVIPVGSPPAPILSVLTGAP